MNSFTVLIECLARRFALSPELTLYTDAHWPLRGRGLLASLPWRAYAARSTLFSRAESRCTHDSG